MENNEKNGKRYFLNTKRYQRYLYARKRIGSANLRSNSYRGCVRRWNGESVVGWVEDLFFSEKNYDKLCREDEDKDEDEDEDEDDETLREKRRYRKIFLPL
ncbi:hypothetical protein M0804_005103 [Polistes exclamans]|nr:hypothetical protein M0804_005103 [Polistes exclamans]